MSKQSFDKVRKTLCIMLAVLLLVSLTAASASAWYNKKGEIIAPPEKPKEEKPKVEAPKETKVENVPAPEIAPAPGAIGDWGDFGDWGAFGNRGGFGCCDRFGNCGKCGDKKKIAVITAVRVVTAKGEGCFDRIW